MKIFLSFLQSAKQHPIAAYSFWEYYIKNGIVESGHEWIECNTVDWAYGLVPQSKTAFNHWKSQAWEKTVNLIKTNRPDLFLSYLYPEQVDANAIAEIQKLGVYCVNFFCDNVRLFKAAPHIYEKFNLNWVPEYKAVKLYQKAGFPYIHLPMPMWIEPKYRQPETNELDSISFIGSKDIQRQLLLEKLFELEPGLKLNIYGSGWVNIEQEMGLKKQPVINKVGNQIHFIGRYGLKAYLNKLKFGRFSPKMSNNLHQLIKGTLNFEDYTRITRESKITIGINRYPSFNYPLLQPNTYSRLRDIEAPMLGACYLTEWTEGLDQLYDLGNEIETFENHDQLLEKIKELQVDKTKRKQLRIKGQQRALAKNTVGESLNKIKCTIS
jgi:spore maturation protein CgeB